MARPPPVPRPLPPPTETQCWLTFWKWVLGIPLLVIGVLGMIWAALWALGSLPMEARAAAIAGAEAAALSARSKRRARKKG